MPQSKVNQLSCKICKNIENQDTLTDSGLKEQHFFFLVLISELNITSSRINRFCSVAQRSLLSLLRVLKLNLRLPLEFQCHYSLT